MVIAILIVLHQLYVTPIH